MTDIFIIAAKRSAIGGYGGSLKDTTPVDLAIPVAQAAIEQSGLPAAAIDHTVYGHVIPVSYTHLTLPTILRV